jgi:uncharacterized protein YndB with AHSA1/START domain
MAKTQTLKFTRVVNAPPAEAYRMFIHPTALRDWLCNGAQVDARPGGHIQLRWDDRYYASGTFLKLEPGKRLAFTWDGYNEPAPTQVQVTFTDAPRNGGTRVTVSRSGFGTGRAWAGAVEGFTSHWPEFLENLQSVLETGVDLRQARRPRMGIGIDDFNPEIAARLGVPVKAGIHLAGTAEGTGARAAGLQKGDVIVKLNGKKAVDFPTLGQALQGLKAGDKPKVVFYRGPEKHTVPLELSRFPIREVPATAAELAAIVRTTHAEIEAELAKMVEGLTEAQADHRPAENEWSVKELIAHLIATERDYQSWVADMLNDTPVNDDLQMRPNVHERLRAMVGRFGTVAALLEELSCAQAETAAFIAAWPPPFVARKHLYRRAALWVLEVTPGHFHEEHGEQFRRTLEAAK